MWGLVLCLTAVLPLFSQSQKLEVTVERREGTAWKAVDPGHVFEQNDSVRFRLKATFAGHLYVMNQGTSGAYTMLFPREDTGRENRMDPGKEYLMPAGPQGAFRISGPAGQDIVYWVISPIELGAPKQEQPKYVPLPPPPARSDKTLESMTPRCDDTILRARGDCVDSSAGPKPVDSLPKHLSGVNSLTSRELFYRREDTKAVVSSPAPLKGPAVFEFRLAHK